MSGLVRVAIACLILLTAGLAPALAEQRRVALVVGNSAYEATSALPNPANDARLFADLLTSQGFEVETLVDVGRAAFAQGLARFEKRIEPGDIALFYYAGHGMQMRGENYLIGVDARLQSEFDVDAEAVSLNSVIGLMERQTSIVLVFIDACRNNPLAERLALADGATRSAPPRGLAPINSTGSGTMVAFAALPGQVAYDGVERNSPFTSSLVEHLATPDLEIGTAFKRVIRDVREKTGGRQSPQIVSNLSAELYLWHRRSRAHDFGARGAGPHGEAGRPADRPAGHGPRRSPGQAGRAGAAADRAEAARCAGCDGFREGREDRQCPRLAVCSLHGTATARWPGRRCRSCARPIRSSPRSSRNWRWR